MPANDSIVEYLLNLNCVGTESSVYICEHEGWASEVGCPSNSPAAAACVGETLYIISSWLNIINILFNSYSSDLISYVYMLNIQLYNIIITPLSDTCIIVDGSFSNWSEWSACSVTCADGQNTRTRACDSPEPARGGISCEGEDIQYRNCTEVPCPGMIDHLIMIFNERWW